MSSTEINKVRIIDSTIGDITDKIVYGVVEGGASITNQNYNAISASPNSASWNIQVPSNETIVSREVLVEATLTAQVTLYNGSAAAVNILNRIGYGGNKDYSSSFAAFPLQSACSSVSLTLNNCTITQNTNELVAMLNTFNSSKFNDRYMATCPTMRDNYRNYNDAVGANNNCLAGYGNNTDNSKCSNGCYAVTITTLAGVVVPANGLGSEQAATTTENYLVVIKVVEPLLLSPFIYDIESTQLQGIYGLSTMSLVLNFSNFNRSFRTSNKVAATGTNVGISAVSFNNIKDARLKLKYITPKNSQLLPSLNVVPYMEFPRYITGNLEEIPAGASLDVNTSSLQLNQIPDKLICFVRRRFGDQTFGDTDSFLPINSVSIQFNNAAGLLSNTSQVELYKMASKAGINQNYLEFSGAANVGVSTSGNNSTVVPLCGPILALDFATDIQLSDTYFAPGSIGQFNVQVKLNVFNNTGANINTLPSNQYEIVLVTVISGVLTTQNGVSAIYSGILSKSDVLETVSQEQFKSRNEVKRLVGGGFFDSLKNALGSIAKVALPIVAPMVKNAISNAGYGMSAGGMSAGKRSKGDPRLM